MDKVLNITLAFATPYVARALVLLEVPETIQNGGPGASLSVHDIAKHLPSATPHTDFLFRLLRYSVIHKILDEVIIDGETRYKLNDISEMLVKKNDPTFAPFLLLMTEDTFQAPFSQLHKAVLNGGNPFVMVNGMDVWELETHNPRCNQLMNDGMTSVTSTQISFLLENYKNFNDIKVIVDVGGGKGYLLSRVVAKYPHIHAINFDLQHVVTTAPRLSGVEHVGGDMFKEVPSGDAIIMKCVLHDWDDADCEKVLKKCYEALPVHGRLIIYETNMSTQEYAESAAKLDLTMLAETGGGKERTAKEWHEVIVKMAGFSRLSITQSIGPMAIFEAYKD